MSGPARTSRLIQWCVVAVLVLIWPVLPAGRAGAAERAPGAVRLAGACQLWSDQGRSLEAVLGVLERAAGERAQIVCLPQECVKTEGGADAKAALEAISQAAKRHGLYVAANLREKAGDKTYLTSYLIGPDGGQIGRYRKTHRLPDEPIALGDALGVFETPLGKIGLMIGTDHYWPEVPLVLALEGAEIILWSHTVEAVPQIWPLEVTARVRAIDNHVTLVSGAYAGDLPYLCSNHPSYAGCPLGRAWVVDRDGTIVADSGHRPGLAVAGVEVRREKSIYHLTFIEDRRLFAPLAKADIKQVQARPVKRQVRVAVAQVTAAHGPSPDPQSAFAKILDEAGRRSPDVIVMSEFGFATDTPAAAKAFEIVSDVCRRHKTYAVIGGLREPQIPYKKRGRASWAFLWDRSGKVVGKYRISQYGDSVELPVFATDFGVIGIILCGDIYSPEITRALAIQGAEVVFCPSQSWGASGQVNLWLQQARALDNAVWMVPAHFPMSDVTQRSYVVDPYGYPLAATGYWCEGVVTADLDLDAGRVWFARSDQPGRAGKPGYLAGYYPRTVPEKRTDFRAVLMAGRRPELYGVIPAKTLAGRKVSDEVYKRMSEPKE
ncbi:MAG: Formamidase [Planctomycetes bacterium ADurb.Bin126]|nr:MAG: Formamidase [Planctomycetes bacterium ADurb.Bin126]HOD82866.1 carbon-nitrogen hydrolase family protein [Phycisphaerae bacterium]HQL75286.1 carbon-nitrogen hydrolase family protein [Phycisphaerae bacterium]